MAIKTIFITTPGSGTFTVPTNFQTLISVEAIGGGGGGGAAARGVGGGGGAYAKSTSVTGLVAGSTAYYWVGAGGVGGTTGSTSGVAGGNTWFNAVSNTVPTLPTQGVLADGGSGGTITGGAVLGGRATNSVGNDTNNGGGGSSANKDNNRSGGGGAAGPGGGGGSSGQGASTGSGSGGGGGGASLNDAGNNGLVGSTTDGGDGGNGGNGIGRGNGANTTTNATSGTPGTGGGGGGGFTVGANSTNCGLGATNSFWLQTSDQARAGSGGGGGGGGSTAAVSGNGGLYGGGGGGGGTTVGAGSGGQGIIVFTYDAGPNDAPPFNTGYSMTDPSTGNVQDLGKRYITKDYLIDVYPNIASQLGNRTAPGLYVWGDNGYGQIGDGTIVSKSSPNQLGRLTDWKQIAVDSHVLAIKTDGTLWSWGLGTDGQLGSGAILSRSSPVQVGASTNWKQVSCGGYGGHSLAVNTLGQLYTWGHNGSGQLGSLNVLPRSVPTLVGADTNWKQVAAIRTASFAIKTNGNLYAWGLNNFGQLGQVSNITNRSSPILIGVLRDWKSIGVGPSAQGAAAIKIDGTLWTWGTNASGQLGLKDVILRSSPTQVGSLTDWKSVNLAQGHCLAIKTDGTLWAWGNNTRGELGDGTIISKSSPIQVGSLTNWKQVFACGDAPSATEYSSIAIKTDGTLWAWGSGFNGKLGDGTVVSKSSPIQIGSSNNWKSIVSSFSGAQYGILDGNF